MRHEPGAWLLSHPGLAEQWDYERNEEHPTTLTAGAHVEVWWINCPVDPRHRWHTQLKSRVLGGQGCSVCRGYQVMEGVNDLATLYPVIAAQWHPDNARPVTSVAAASRFVARWRGCDIDARHEWEASVDSRTLRGAGCTVCLGFTVMRGVNDVLTVAPSIAREWSDRNAKGPHEYSWRSGLRVYWKCVLGHEWPAIVAGRTGEPFSGCPACSRTGVDPSLPTLLYLIRHQEFRAVKVGITGPLSSRIQDFKSAGWDVLRAVVKGDGLAARASEMAMLRWWRDGLSLPPWLGPEEMRNGGWSETVCLDELPLYEALSRMR
jgi:hypothetical protein